MLAKFPRSTSLNELFDYQAELDDRHARVILSGILFVAVLAGGFFGLNWLLKWLRWEVNEFTAVASHVAFLALVFGGYSWTRRALWGRADQGPQSLIEIKAERAILKKLIQEKII